MAAFDDEFVPGSERSADDLRRIASYQRWLVTVVLGQLVLWLGFLALIVLGGHRLTDEAFQFPMIGTFILGGGGGYYVSRLALTLRGPVTAVILGPMTVIPAVGLIVMSRMNGYATTELRKHGVKVGMFGASQADINKPPLALR